MTENTAEDNNNNNNNNNNYNNDDETIVPKLESFLQKIPSMTICKLINVLNVLVNDSGGHLQLISSYDPQFSDQSPVCGHVNEKKQLIEALVWPRKYLPLFHLYKMNPINGILLFGPPGTGYYTQIIIILSF